MKKTLSVVLVLLGVFVARAQEQTSPVASKSSSTDKADPLASKLLAEARAARAQWLRFPGFSADIEVNLDGQLSRGKLRISADRKVAFEDLDQSAHGPRLFLFPSWRTEPAAASGRTHRPLSSSSPQRLVYGQADRPL